MSWVNEKQLREFDPPLAVEQLVYEVEQAAYETWKAAEFELWTQGEADRFPFYVGKETWLCKGDPETGAPHKVTIVIYWTSVEEWYSIEPEFLETQERLFSARVGADNYRLVHEGHLVDQYFKISEYR